MLGLGARLDQGDREGMRGLEKPPLLRALAGVPPTPVAPDQYHQALPPTHSLNLAATALAIVLIHQYLYTKTTSFKPIPLSSERDTRVSATC